MFVTYYVLTLMSLQIIMVTSMNGGKSSVTRYTLRQIQISTGHSLNVYHKITITEGSLND